MNAPAPSSVIEQTKSLIKKELMPLIGFSLGINLLMLSVPLYMLQLYDRVLPSRSTDTLLMLTVLVILALIIMAGLEVVRTLMMVRISAWADRRISAMVIFGTITQALSRMGASTTQQGLRDLNTVRNFVGGSSFFAFFDAPWVPLYLIIIFLLHPALGLIATIGALALFGLGFFNEYITRDPLQRANSQAAVLTGQMESSFRNADVIQSMGMMPAILSRWQQANERILALQSWASDMSGYLTAFTRFIRLTLQVSILGVGAYLVNIQELTPGGMIAASIIMGRALGPVEQAIGTWRGFVGARSCYGRLKALLDRVPLQEKGMSLPKPQGALSVEQVGYAYPNNQTPVLLGVSFRLEAGESVGVIGPSASGKSTLARVLVGNLLPQRGAVRLDAVELAKWDPDERGKYIGYLPQDIELFQGTVRDNIARFQSDNDDHVIAAAKLAGIHDMILHFPNGYDTDIGVGGVMLSGGQRQSIALARALYREPSLVVLDEPNSNLDGQAEQGLSATFARLKEKKITVVVISHRLTILRAVDKVLVMRAGRVSNFVNRDDFLLSSNNAERNLLSSNNPKRKK